ncbi:MAG TPA: glycerophosphodiester phosphodiesterase [Nannocystis exedens]|nr:glycerophosphodiester phosphodiesterase [Nannocystis exedens]
MQGHFCPCIPERMLGVRIANAIPLRMRLAHQEPALPGRHGKLRMRFLCACGLHTRNRHYRDVRENCECDPFAHAACTPPLGPSCSPRAPRMIARRPYFDMPRPYGFAHRGGAAVAPENTIFAFKRAVEAGFHHLETDVHLTRDGELVTVHDPTVERTTDGVGLVRTFTLAELRRLDAGYRFTVDGSTFPYRGMGIRIPTLAQVLEIDPKVRVNIEIKERDPTALRAVWGFIQHHRAFDRVLVASEHASVVAAFRELSRGRVATSAGSAEILRFWLATRLRLGPRKRPAFDALQVPARHGPLTVVDAAFLRNAHRHGLDVHVWTIDDETEMRRLLALGVDALMSDYPERLADVLKDR